jgi:hypothetical protein
MSEKNTQKSNEIKTNELITISWENIDVFTPSSHEGLNGKIKRKLCFFKQEIPSKNIIKKGKNIKEFRN